MRKPKMMIDYDQLKRYCLSAVKGFEKGAFGEVTHTPLGSYVYKDNGSRVLAVAHRDTVNALKHFHVVDVGADQRVYTTACDDRLGVYIICALLPTLGITVDWLLTENEEQGASTARHFQPPAGKTYDWMFMWDRAGEDAVMYQYDTAASRAKLTAAGFTPAKGSYSCIRELESLGCCGFNFGTGYFNPHHEWAGVEIPVLLRQIKRFVKFYDLYANTPMPWTKPVEASHTTYYSHAKGSRIWMANCWQWQQWDNAAQAMSYTPLTDDELTLLNLRNVAPALLPAVNHSRGLTSAELDSLMDNPRSWQYFPCEGCHALPHSGVECESVADTGFCTHCWEAYLGEQTDAKAQQALDDSGY